jgi:muramoyltetrapeptide carboxypeptidase
MTNFWPTIKPSAIIDVIAPSGRFESHAVGAVAAYIRSQGWQPRMAPDLLGEHDFLANTDVLRFEQLQAALEASDSDIIWCMRGGHGTTRLMPELMKLPKPAKPKLLVGFSDITTLHLFLNQTWQWPSLHGPMARQVAMGESHPEDVTALLQLWQGGLPGYTLTSLMPLNESAMQLDELSGITIGTCISLLQTSLGTPWQIDSTDKIIFVEDVNEQPYRLDRLLVHLQNAYIWSAAKAIVLGDFGENIAPVDQVKISHVLQEFAQTQTIPVLQLTGFGHGKRNKPIPLGVKATLTQHQGAFNVHF